MVKLIYNLVTDPISEFRLMLEFLGVDPTKLKFEYNPEKGFYCLLEPVDQCLSKSKGRTRSEKFEDPNIKYKSDFEIFHRFYQNQMQMLSQLLPNSTNRFSWLKN